MENYSIIIQVVTENGKEEILILCIKQKNEINNIKSIDSGKYNMLWKHESI